MVSSDQQTILLRIRPMNRALVLARRAAGFESVAALCRAHPKLNAPDVGDLENLRAPARNKVGELRPVAERLCKAYQLDEEILFPQELDGVHGGDREMSLTSKQMLLASQARAIGVFGGSQPLNPEEALELKELQAEVYDAVGHRSAAVLAMRHDGYSTEEVGSLIGISGGGASSVAMLAKAAAEKRLEVIGTVKELLPFPDRLYYGCGVCRDRWWMPAGAELRLLPEYMHSDDGSPFNDLRWKWPKRKNAGRCILQHQDGWTAIAWWDPNQEDKSMFMMRGVHLWWAMREALQESFPWAVSRLQMHKKKLKEADPESQTVDVIISG